MLGADGVWVGTRLVATDEAYVHPEHKRRLVAASAGDTVYSSIFGPEDPAFNPMRLLRNRVVSRMEPPSRRRADGAIRRSRRSARPTMGGQAMTLRKFNVLLPIPETEGRLGGDAVSGRTGRGSRV